MYEQKCLNIGSFLSKQVDVLLLSSGYESEQTSSLS